MQLTLFEQVENDVACMKKTLVGELPRELKRRLDSYVKSEAWYYGVDESERLLIKPYFSQITKRLDAEKKYRRKCGCCF